MIPTVDPFVYAQICCRHSLGPSRPPPWPPKIQAIDEQYRLSVDRLVSLYLVRGRVGHARGPHSKSRRENNYDGPLLFSLCPARIQGCCARSGTIRPSNHAFFFHGKKRAKWRFCPCMTFFQAHVHRPFQTSTFSAQWWQNKRYSAPACRLFRMEKIHMKKFFPEGVFGLRTTLDGSLES